MGNRDRLPICRRFKCVIRLRTGKDRYIISSAAVDRVVTRVTRKDVIAGTAVNRVIAGSARYVVIAGTTVNGVLAGAASNDIIVGPGINRVISSTTGNGIIPRATLETIVSAVTRKNVVTTGAQNLDADITHNRDCVGLTGSRQDHVVVRPVSGHANIRIGKPQRFNPSNSIHVTGVCIRDGYRQTISRGRERIIL